MPACAIDPAASATFRRTVKHLEKRCPRIWNDLTDVFEDIEEDYERAAGARPLAGFSGTGGKVWKYRCPSSDLQKGKRGAFRIIAFYLPAANTLYPLLVYSKDEDEGLPRNVVMKAIRELKVALNRP